MLITISTLFYGKPDVCRKFLQSVKPILDNRKDIELIVRDNGCLDGELGRNIVLGSGIRNLVYIPQGMNVGFGEGHNANLELARGKYFIVLNNDLFFMDPHWPDKLTKPFENDNPTLKLIGLEGAPCFVNFNAISGDVNGIRSRNLEYIEGSCIAGITEDFRKYGLFSSAYDKFLCEDSDLSLRFRQMGFGISITKIPHQHLRSVSLNLVDGAYRSQVLGSNLDVFRKRWSRYMTNRKLTNRILIKMASAGIGDILCMTPIVEAIRRDHPTAAIEVTTTCPEIFIGNKNLTELYEIKREYPQQAYDRVIEVQPNYASYDLIAKEAEKIAATKLNSYLPQVFLSRMEIDEGASFLEPMREEKGQVIGVCLENNRPNWEGRCYPHQHSINLIEYIKSTGAKVVELGKGSRSSGVADLDLVDKLTLRQLFAVMAHLDVFIGIDSLCFHVAQAFKIPSFVLFGATHWKARTIDMRNVFPIFKENLGCYGCYQSKGQPTFNKCLVGTQECMRDLSPEDVMSIITKPFDELFRRNIGLLQDFKETRI